DRVGQAEPFCRVLARRNGRELRIVWRFSAQPGLLRRLRRLDLLRRRMRRGRERVVAGFAIPKPLGLCKQLSDVARKSVPGLDLGRPCRKFAMGELYEIAQGR